MKPEDDPIETHRLLETRRHFLSRTATGIGSVALASLLEPELFAGTRGQEGGDGGILASTHHRPTAKRVIYLCMAGAPSQIDLWDHKPEMSGRFDQDLPESVIMGQRFTTMTSKQERFPIAPSIFDFARHGESGTYVSELLPHTARVVDRLCLVKSMTTEAINHDPAITFMLTGLEQPGRPSAGAWVSYGLGSPNRNLPSFVVLHSSWSAKRDAQALFSRLWGSAFLPAKHQGVALRSSGDPVLFLSDPPGIDRPLRRRMLDALAELNQRRMDEEQDPEIATRIAQYELAYRMQASVPELFDLGSEPESVLELYGPDVRKPGTFAANCLHARRLAERDVRFVQIFHRGWDHHFALPSDLRLQCRDVDQACGALITDLAQRGLLEDTLVVWAGEFGRTMYCQGELTPDNYGRDHHPRCWTVWLAGGGVKPGFTWGETDEFSYNVVRDPVHVHDLNATILHTLGIDHLRMTYRNQGRDHRLTDVHGEVVHGILA